MEDKKCLAIELPGEIYSKLSLIAKIINREKIEIIKDEIKIFIENFESELKAIV